MPLLLPMSLKLSSFYKIIAPVGTPENFRAKAAQREVEFSWSRPKVTAPISSYTLSCDPSPGTLPLTVTEAGTHRIKEFYPDYFYWCSVVANYGSSVSGPPATTDVCTEEDRKSITVEPLDTPKSGQPPYNGQTVCPLPIYSGTSDKGPSEIGTTSLQRTLVAAPC